MRIGGRLFPGSVWYLYELTGDSTLLPLAAKYTDAIEEAKNLTWHHDIGFIVNCSFGNGLRLAGTPSYKDVMVQAAKSLSTRFRPAAGIIQSWDVERGWQSERGWECPVIIDNMMNLELMFEATRLSGDSSFYKIAVSHADRTMEEHFRPDGSCYHVIDYSIKDGKVRHRQTAQGYADESIWSRGQAWAIYGYAVCYRETKDRKYLDQALKTFNMMKNLESMPEDLIPYWDMSARISRTNHAMYRRLPVSLPRFMRSVRWMFRMQPAIKCMPTVSWFHFLLRPIGLHWAQMETSC